MSDALTSDDTRYIELALDLAHQGIGLASPNPTVGAVLVKDGAVVGEGTHHYDARDHAEIVAIRAAGERAGGATLYLTLEPCCHTGRTGPCTEAIIAAGIRRVVTSDLGTEQRQIIAGLRPYVPVEELLGKEIIVVANLEPRKMRGLESNGMLLAASHGDGDQRKVVILTPAKDVPPGSPIS